MTIKNFKLLIFLSISCFIQANLVFSQTIQKQKMQKLEHFTGDWVGISKAFENGTVIREIPAFEKISYKIDEHILTIDLYSESLKLHTVIYYDDEAKTYYYNPFYKTGTARYPAKLVNEKLIVMASKTKRFIFEITEEGKFREYGEYFKNGEWTIYFEDIFQRQ